MNHVNRLVAFVFALLAAPVSVLAATLYVNPAGTHAAPFSAWETAATNIQAAINAANVGDTVLVTNGVYNTGGTRVMGGTTTNRVAITKAISVRSVNGPVVTIIEGYQTPGATNGNLSIRGAWVASAATLDGFTLTKGSTFGTADTSGGGIYCQSATAIVTNCVIIGNAAAAYGAGIYGGTAQHCVISRNDKRGAYLTDVFDSVISDNIGTGVSGEVGRLSVVSNCVISGNKAGIKGGGAFLARLLNCIIRDNTADYGGGTHSCFQTNCAIFRNSAKFGGGGVCTDGNTSSAAVQNCTIVLNSAGTFGGVYAAQVWNSIIYYNYGASGSHNYSPTVKMTNSCTFPLPGAGNIAEEPQLLSDAIHLSATSPCINAGAGNDIGVDIDGQAWIGQPSMGCDQWRPEPILVSQPRVVIAAKPGEAALRVEIAGDPAWCQWTKYGIVLETNVHYSFAHSNSVLVHNFSPADAGDYQVLATNLLGSVTSAVVRINVACVDAANAAGTPPYINWATAATTIQDAIDTAEQGTVILVTNGVYATGGRAATNNSPSRIVADKPVTILSMNGPAVTAIEGAWDPSTTNGPASVRCAWLGIGAQLGGFTLVNGSCTNKGGGVWSADSGFESRVVGCVVTNCRATFEAGGAHLSRLENCSIMGNASAVGGGATDSVMYNCLVGNNWAVSSGGGTYQSMLDSCVVTHNSAPRGAGIQRGFASNTLIATNSGGGVLEGSISSCRIVGNIGNGATSSSVRGSLLRGNTGYGTESSTNLNCTFTENAIARSASRSTNCLFAFNKTLGSSAMEGYCAYYPGSGSISIDRTSFINFPNLLSDATHLADDSPCLGRGTHTGLVKLDVDGHPLYIYDDPPPIGCDEWHPEPLLVRPPRVVPGSSTGEAVLFVELAGRRYVGLWSKDGTTVHDDTHYSHSVSTRLSINDFNVADAGTYQVIIPGHMVFTIQVKVACVDAASPNPTAPYDTWATAARTIQDAIDAADIDTVVLVTNGTYSTGSRTVAGQSASRVVIDKPITVLSMGGPSQTVIQGAWDPATTNGANSIRCAYLADGAMLGGFTLANGSTLDSGGGVFNAGNGLRENVINCVFTNCRAATNGGAGYQGRFRDCVFTGNASGGNGGAAANAVVERSLLTDNTALQGGAVFEGATRGCRILNNIATDRGGGAAGFGQVLVSSAVAMNKARYCGGVYAGTVYNCTIVSNTASAARVAGMEFATVVNSIVHFNQSLTEPGSSFENVGGSSTPQNICSRAPWAQLSQKVLGSNPQLVDFWHIATNSPCQGYATNLGSVGFPDIDGEDWRSPASVGCDEFVSAGVTGQLSIAISAWPQVAVGAVMPLTANVQGRASAITWAFGDGTNVTDAGFNPAHSWTAQGAYKVTATAFNADNPTGVSATVPVQVVPLASPEFTLSSQGDGIFSASFTGQPGVTYQILTSTNLDSSATWELLKTVTSLEAAVSFTETNTSPARFYRLRAQ